jgi:hypothetical protein
MGWSPLSQRRQASIGTPTPTSGMIPTQAGRRNVSNSRFTSCMNAAAPAPFTTL